MITILRLARRTGFLTAEVFESLFDRQFGDTFAIRRAPPGEWCDEVMGPVAAPLDHAAAARRFAAATAGVDFLCPGFEAIPLTPLLVAVRNRSRSRVRLLFIAHAAGAYSMEWALLRPLLAPGDLIIAPSASAARAIDALCPSLTPFTRVIHHPMAPLAAGPATSDRMRIVTLSRIQDDKLIHRQIEAMAVLRQHRVAMPLMEIAGSLESAYARTLAAKIQRYGLDNDVHLVGPVRGDEHKAAFLSGARALVNLSVTVEESFPKAPVEALGAGVPVLATAWDGLHETVGPGGVLLSVTVAPPDDGRADVTAAAVAQGLEQLIADPPAPDICRAHAARFRPEIGVPRYHAAMEEALDQPALCPDLPDTREDAAPASGLLRGAGPLGQLSWRALFALYTESCPALRIGGTTAPGLTVRALVQAGVRAPLTRLFAGLPLEPVPAPSPRPLTPPPLAVQLGAAAASPGDLAGRVACLRAALETEWPTHHAGAVIDRLAADGMSGAMVATLSAEVAERSGHLADAFARCAAALDHWPPAEADADRIRQIARVARRMGRPEQALPWLAAWLDRFPDAPDAAPVWLDRCLSASRAGAEHERETDEALERSRALLLNTAVVGKAHATIAANRLANALA